MRKSLSLSLLLGTALTLASFAARAQDVPIYSSLPNPAPPNLPSQAFEATQTVEFGDYVQFAGSGPANLDSVTVDMSNWAQAVNYPTWALANSTGYSVPLTLTLYAPGSSGTATDPSVGAVIATEQINAFIPWRQVSDPTNCPNDQEGGAYSVNGTCYHGALVPVTFNFNGLTVPNAVIWGLSFNTTDYGSNPTGVPGPYDSLNVALNDSASIGTDVDPDGVYINTGWSGDLTTGTVNVFGPDTGWSGYVPAAEFDAVPEPASMALLGLGLAGLGAIRRRRR